MLYVDLLVLPIANAGLRGVRTLFGQVSMIDWLIYVTDKMNMTNGRLCWRSVNACQLYARIVDDGQWYCVDSLSKPISFTLPFHLSLYSPRLYQEIQYMIYISSIDQASSFHITHISLSFTVKSFTPIFYVIWLVIGVYE